MSTATIKKDNFKRHQTVNKMANGKCSKKPMEDPMDNLFTGPALLLMRSCLDQDPLARPETGVILQTLPVSGDG